VVGNPRFWSCCALGGCVLAGCALWLAAIGVAAAQTGPERRTTLDGVFSKPQAERGRNQYIQNCLICHLDNLGGDGGNVPALADDQFLRAWSGGKTLDDLYTRIKTRSPEDSPASLSDSTYLDILAFILQENEFPPGSDELTVEALKHTALVERAGREVR
jgi:quinoprotein glucose dehydrogenase